MRRIYILLCGACFLALPSQAQHVGLGPLHSADDPREDWILPGDTIYRDGKPMIYSGKPIKNANAQQHTDSAPALQTANNWWYGGLHKGLNFSVDLSAFATFGKHVPHRGGFAQTIDATYLTPITKDNKLWMALGAYVNNVNYGSANYHDGGLYGILGYRFDEHWEAYVYGQLSIANNYNSLYGRYGAFSPWGYGYYPEMMGFGRGIMPLGYGMGAPAANILGAGVRYTNKNFSLGINIEGVWYDNKVPSYYKKYDYPVPEAPGNK